MEIDVAQEETQSVDPLVESEQADVWLLWQDIGGEG